MKHKIRKIVYDWHGEKKYIVEEIDCELGSGVYDKNGNEIFEGDRVTNGRHTLHVKFTCGSLLIFNERDGEGYTISPHFAQGFEIAND